MPRKTKEQKELENEKKEEKVAKKTTTKKASSTSKVATTEKASTTSKNTTTKKASATKKPTTTSKKSSTTAKKKITDTEEKANTKKATTKKSAEKATSTAKKSTAKATSTAKKKSSTVAKKATTKNKTATAKKSTTKKNASPKKKVDIVEYYDLPYRYNQTIVKVLAQTPTNLFIYWDISDQDRKNLEKQYGDNFFETTKPILIIYNDTLGYHFEIEINDFANSWYLHVADSKCNYRIELGRRPIVKTENLNTDYIYITTSNEIESPNDRILLDTNQKMVYFRNVKTGKQTRKATVFYFIYSKYGKNI